MGRGKVLAEEWPDFPTSIMNYILGIKHRAYRGGAGPQDGSATLEFSDHTRGVVCPSSDWEKRDHWLAARVRAGLWFRLSTIQT